MSRLNILIVIDNLHTGGVATSLYNLLYNIHEEYNIHLMIFNEDSVEQSRMPSNVLVVKPCRALHILGKTHSEIKKESFFLMLYRLVMIFIARYINGVVARMLVWPFVKKLEKNYDFAIAYAQDDSYKTISKGCIDYIIKKVKAQRKAVVVHNDYKNFGGYNPRQFKIYDKLDTIICVSNSCVSSFVSCFPQLKDKTIACENFTNVEQIRYLAGEGVEYSTDTVNFVTACRLSEEKGLKRAILAFSELHKSGITNFTWTIIGGGPECISLKCLVEEEGLSSQIRLLGTKANPYPYIKNASCFLLTSFHEAAPMVFGEAASLGVPILTTETCSAIELVQDRGLGIVVANNYDGILGGLKNFIQNHRYTEVIDKTEMEININAINQFNYFIELNK